MSYIFILPTPKQAGVNNAMSMKCEEIFESMNFRSKFG